MSLENDIEQGEVTGFHNTNFCEIVFVKTELYGTATFELSLPVWEDSCRPRKGEMVILSEITRYHSGWRAMKARKFILMDEKNSNFWR